MVKSNVKHFFIYNSIAIKYLTYPISVKLNWIEIFLKKINVKLMGRELIISKDLFTFDFFPE